MEQNSIMIGLGIAEELIEHFCDWASTSALGKQRLEFAQTPTLPKREIAEQDDSGFRGGGGTGLDL